MAALPEGLTIGIDVQRAVSHTSQRFRPCLCRFRMLDVPRTPQCGEHFRMPVSAGGEAADTDGHSVDRECGRTDALIYTIP